MAMVFSSPPLTRVLTAGNAAAIAAAAWSTSIPGSIAPIAVRV